MRASPTKEDSMKTCHLLIAAAVALTLAAPARAQLLGGLTGGLDKAISGSLSNRIDSRIDKSIDRRSGRASVGSSADGMLGGTLEGATGLTGPNHKLASSKSLRAEKRVSKSASVEADAPGTSDGGDLVGGLTGSARSALGSVAERRQGTPASAQKQVPGSANESASSGSASFGSLLNGSGSLAGSASGSVAGDGWLDVGTLVRDAKGRAVGHVQDVREETQTVLVSVGKRVAEVPAGSLSANGQFATSTMTKGEMKKMATTADGPGAKNDDPAMARAGRY